MSIDNHPSELKATGEQLPDPDAGNRFSPLDVPDENPGSGCFRTGYSWAVGGLIILIYCTFLTVRFQPAIAAADANGYWAQGSLIAQTGRTWFAPEASPQYKGMHWLITPDGRYFSRYPAGLPVFIAIVYKLGGPEAGILVNPVLAVLSLIGMGLLAGLLFGRWWGVIAMLLLACNPIFSRHALQCDSHMAVTALLVWGLLALILWSRRGHWYYAFAAGMLLGTIPTVRYPEALYAVAIAAFLLYHWKRSDKWTGYLAATAGAALPLLPLLIHNHLAFGAFWRTAYALTREQTGFALSYFRSNAMHYIESLQGDGLGLLMCPGLLGIGVLCIQKKSRPLGVLLVLLIVPSTLLYMSYYWAPQHMTAGTLRFLLPTFPCYILGTLYTASLLCEVLKNRTAGLALTVPLIVYVIWGSANSVTDTRMSTHHKRVLADLTRHIAEYAQDDDIILSGTGLLQHLDYIRRWRLADMDALRPHWLAPRIAERLERNDRPSPVQPEKLKKQMEQYAGLGPLALQRTVAEELRSWADGRRILFVGTPEELERMTGWHFGQRQFRVLATLDLPPPPDDFRAEQRNFQEEPDRREGGQGLIRRLAGERPVAAGAAGGLRRLFEWSRARQAVIAEWTWNPL